MSRRERVRAFLRAGAFFGSAAWLALAALILTAILSAQSARQAYRDAYRAWREWEPGLERDALTAGPALGARADGAAGEAAKYYAAKRLFLDDFSQDFAQKFAWLARAPQPASAAASRENDYVATESEAVRKAIQAYTGDPDPAIQEVRGMLERENAALAAVSAGVAERTRDKAEADAATMAMSDAWRSAFDRDHEIATLLVKSGASVEKETSAWTAYYRTFSDAARGVLTESNVILPPRPPAPVNVAPSITPLPLVRYTGDWIYPETGGIFHGAEPAAVDLEVRESNGHCTGKIVARFKLPPGSGGDPNLRFDFSGEFKNSRIQSFALTTPDGSQGTIDLIPGPAFNLLEINVNVAGRPGTVRQANAVLVKK